MTTPLDPYRVLDLTEGGFNWCGKVLADLGADVIKVEPPGGSPTRDIGPFVDGQRGLERSLFWAAYCANKRGVIIDLDSDAGREQMLRLAGGADILIESFRPGYMDATETSDTPIISEYQSGADLHVHHTVWADGAIRSTPGAGPNGVVDGWYAVHLRRRRSSPGSRQCTPSRAPRRRTRRRGHYGGFLASGRRAARVSMWMFRCRPPSSGR